MISTILFIILCYCFHSKNETIFVSQKTRACFCLFTIYINSNRHDQIQFQYFNIAVGILKPMDSYIVFSILLTAIGLLEKPICYRKTKLIWCRDYIWFIHRWLRTQGYRLWLLCIFEAGCMLKLYTRKRTLGFCESRVSGRKWRTLPLQPGILFGNGAFYVSEVFNKYMNKCDRFKIYGMSKTAKFGLGQQPVQ